MLPARPLLDSRQNLCCVRWVVGPWISALFVVACGASPSPSQAPSGKALAAQGSGARAPLVLEARVNSCALLSSCSRSTDPTWTRDVGGCVARGLALGMNDAVLACVDAARTCTDVDACLGREHEAEARPLCDARAAAADASGNAVPLVFCDANRVVSCEEGHPQMTACAEVGGTCREFKIASGVIIRGCHAPQLCGPDAPASRCDAQGRVVTCQQGLGERTRCPIGMRCADFRTPDGEPDARCLPLSEKGSAPCVPGTPGRCDGEVAVRCVAGEDGRGSWMVTDCAASALACRELIGAGSPTKDVTCMVPGGDADAWSAACVPGPARCERGAVRLCAGGIPVRLHCETLGLGPCQYEAGAASCGHASSSR